MMAQTADSCLNDKRYLCVSRSIVINRTYVGHFSTRCDVAQNRFVNSDNVNSKRHLYMLVCKGGTDGGTQETAKSRDEEADDKATTKYGVRDEAKPTCGEVDTNGHTQQMSTDEKETVVDDLERKSESNKQDGKFLWMLKGERAFPVTHLRNFNFEQRRLEQICISLTFCVCCIECKTSRP